MTPGYMTGTGAGATIQQLLTALRQVAAHRDQSSGAPASQVQQSFAALPFYGPQDPQSAPPSGNVSPQASLLAPQPTATPAVPMPQPRPTIPQAAPMPQPRDPWAGIGLPGSDPSVTPQTANGGDLIKKFMAQLQNSGSSGAPGAFGTTSGM